MEDMDHFYSIFLQTFQTYKKVEREMHRQNPDVNHSEMHLIEAIDRLEDASITALAQQQGVSKSAVSQMVSKLVNKGYVHKQISPKAENTVVLTLTSSGEKLCREHEKVHSDIYRKVRKILAKYPSGTEEMLAEVLTDLQKAWLSFS